MIVIFASNVDTFIPILCLKICCQLRRFALAYFHSHGDATGFFRNAFLGIVELTPSDNRVRHIVSSQDDAVAGLMGR